MPGVHLDQMLRFCGAETIVKQQSTVFMNNLLSAVEGDINTHGMLGQLVSTSPGTVFIEGKKMIVSMMDQAMPDKLSELVQHVTNFPTPQKGSQNVFAYGGPGMMAGGLGSMLSGGLLNGEMVSMAGNMIGQVQNFTNIGLGQGLAILSGMNGGMLGAIPSVGSTIIGMTSGNSFTFSSVES